MRRTLTAVAAFAALGAAAILSAGSLFVLELSGGARLFALDRPIEKGRVLVFHRHPDGVFTSIPAGEVARIAPASAADRTQKFAPGELMVLGRDVEGPTAEGSAPPSAPAAARSAYSMPDYGYGVYWGYSFGGGRRPPLLAPPPRSVSPPLVGPNGYPGTPQLPIGSNGFPIISPQPPQPR